MDRVFPLGLPFATGFYLCLYVLTLVIHVFFMNYVLAGTAYLAVMSFVGGGTRSTRIESPKALVLRDWLPFALGLAITAGVAPLLFVQVLYQKSFYTANLLGFHRRMSILPVLIVGYYLIYLLSSRRIERWGRLGRIMIGVGAFACLAWTGYSWTENHMLSRHAEVWPQLYASGSMMYHHPEVRRRLAVWFFGAIPTMSVILAWQLRYAERRGRFMPAREPRRTAVMALGGLVLSVLCGGFYYLRADESVRRAITSAMAFPYLWVAVVGLVLQFLAWGAQLTRAHFAAGPLAAATAGVALTVIGTTVVREAVRLSSVDLTVLYPLHEQAFRVGGFPVFLVCFAAVAVLIAWCVALVRRACG
jgi:hypothetical protein